MRVPLDALEHYTTHPLAFHWVLSGVPGLCLYVSPLRSWGSSDLALASRTGSFHPSRLELDLFSYRRLGEVCSPRIFRRGVPDYG